MIFWAPKPTTPCGKDSQTDPANPKPQIIDPKLHPDGGFCSALFDLHSWTQTLWMPIAKLSVLASRRREFLSIMLLAGGRAGSDSKSLVQTMGWTGMI